MARKSLDIIARVIDAASSTLKKIQNQLSNTGLAAKTTSKGFVEFNRALFATTALASTFSRIFSKVSDSIVKGAQLGRVEEQYERILGPRGQLITLIEQTTTTGIDAFTAMRSGIELANLGIVKNVRQLADVVSRAGTAAKLAGKDAGEGVEEYTAFLKDGSISHLEFFNIIARTNPELQALLSVLKQAGGVMGTVYDTQLKLALGQRLMDAATRNQLKGQRDLLDTVTRLSSAWKLLSSSLGILIGRSLIPFMTEMTSLLSTLAGFIDRVSTSDSLLARLTRTLIPIALLVTAVSGAVAISVSAFKLLGLASLRLIFTIPLLARSIAILRLAFMGLLTVISAHPIAATIIAIVTAIVLFRKEISEIVKSFSEWLSSFHPIDFAFSFLTKSVDFLTKKLGDLHIGFSKVFGIVGKPQKLGAEWNTTLDPSLLGPLATRPLFESKSKGPGVGKQTDIANPVHNPSNPGLIERARRWQEKLDRQSDMGQAFKKFAEGQTRGDERFTTEAIARGVERGLDKSYKISGIHRGVNDRGTRRDNISRRGTGLGQ